MKNQSNQNAGFTLVELLVVITIIGVIAAIAIPANGMVRRTVSVASMEAEMSVIEQGIDSYKTKYKDYPPDFSDWGVVKRHYIKIFPDIADSELQLLLDLCDTRPDSDPTFGLGGYPHASSADFDPFVMDRAEALVWSLGGFSADPQYPFSGEGGPLEFLDAIAGVPAADMDRENPAHYQYRVTRNAPMVDFKPERLTVQPLVSATGPSYANGVFDRNHSIDEPQGILGGFPAQYQTRDIFPTYILRRGGRPVVYFDARTYAWNNGVAFNGYVDYEDGVDASSVSIDDLDGIRPVYSTTANKPPVGGYPTLAASASSYQFANPTSFQIHAPGLDGSYGTMLDLNGGGPSDTEPVYFQVNGEMLALNGGGGPAQKVPAVSRFDITAASATNPTALKATNKMRDNMSNIVKGTFESQLP